ncbi:MAG: DUF2892 domain-containing protein [Puniceicoccaceae bacterium]|nr:MAG: DUF2892 domain-containing protein [Puniceicoccaceae bacterium]
MSRLNPDSFIRVLAGSMVLLSLGLAQLHSPWWLLLTGFVGLNLIQSALTGFCPPTLIGRRLGWFRDEAVGCRLSEPRQEEQR